MDLSKLNKIDRNMGMQKDFADEVLNLIAAYLEYTDDLEASEPIGDIDISQLKKHCEEIQQEAEAAKKLVEVLKPIYEAKKKAEDEKKKAEDEKKKAEDEKKKAAASKKKAPKKPEPKAEEEDDDMSFLD